MKHLCRQQCFRKELNIPKKPSFDRGFTAYLGHFGTMFYVFLNVRGIGLEAQLQCSLLSTSANLWISKRSKSIKIQGLVGKKHKIALAGGQVRPKPGRRFFGGADSGAGKGAIGDFLPQMGWKWWLGLGESSLNELIPGNHSNLLRNLRMVMHSMCTYIGND